LKHVKITGYQGIEQAEIDLHDGINVFVGPTDSGKSSLVRALRDFFYNTVGDFFVTVGKKKAVVEVDGVRWEKSSKDNRYVIGDQVYEKVGRGVVPEEVQQKTGVREVEFGEGVVKRLNISEQFGNEFIISDKASDNAKVVGGLSGIGIVFNALRDSTSELQKAKRNLGTLEDREKEADEKVRSFDYLKKVTAFVQKIGENIEKIQEKTNLFDDLSQLKAVLCAAKQSKKSALELVAKHKILADISFKKYDEIEEQKNNLYGLIGAHQDAMEDIEGWKVDVTSCKAFTSINLEHYEELEATRKVINDLSSKEKICQGAILAAKEIVKRQRREVTDCIQEYEETIAKFELCPLTGRKMPEVCKKALKEEGNG
jgi:exonuclease SbcC